LNWYAFKGIEKRSTRSLEMSQRRGQAEGLLLVRIDQLVIGRLAVGNETQLGRVSLALVHHALSSWHLSEPAAKVDHASPVVALDVPK
jgi:hypothetical protein